MAVAQLRRFPAILASMLSRVVVRAGLTDITDVARSKRFLAAVARELDEVYYQIVRVTDVWALDSATGEDLDRRVADLQPLGLTRLGARRATGNLVFSRRVAGADTRVIPAGSIGITEAGIAARSLRETEIRSTSAEQVPGHGVGRDSLPVPAIAINAGASGNVVAGAIRRLQGTILGVDEVTNTAPFLNGRDGETDDELRARAKAYIASLARCDYRALEYAAIGLSDGTREVLFARAVMNPARRGDVSLFIDDGTGSAETTEDVLNELVTEGLLGPPADRAVGGEEYLTLNNAPVRLESPWEVRVNGTALLPDSTVFLSPTDALLRFVTRLSTGDEVRADYTRYTGLIPVVQQVINGVRGDATLRGWGAAGVRVRVRTPRVVSPTLTGTVYVREGATRADVLAAAENAAIARVNRGGISEDVIMSQIIGEVMRVPNVTDFVLDQRENVTIHDDEIARIASVDFD